MPAFCSQDGRAPSDSGGEAGRGGAVRCRVTSLAFRCSMSLGTKRDFRERTGSTPPHPPLTPALSPQDFQEMEVLGGEGESRRDLDPGRRAEFLLRTLPWANVCCPFRALYGRRGSCRVTISQKTSNLQRTFQRALVRDLPLSWHAGRVRSLRYQGEALG